MLAISSVHSFDFSKTRLGKFINGIFNHNVQTTRPIIKTTTTTTQPPVDPVSNSNSNSDQ